ncbi:hypothetical protein HID58_032362 [Brassica napus]|uniref:Uncharacterized protein n=1 Tax=Brassica napus TaxID=3708 RepID=A0ABQ8BW57_BRANA|nr:hypothetical protein HID58_032362 [Brassica napus]
MPSLDSDAQNRGTTVRPEPVTPRKRALEVMNAYVNILNSDARRKASVPNKSTIRAVGFCVIAAILDRRAGTVSRIMTPILVTTWSAGSTNSEMSGEGRLTTSRPVETKTVTRKPWLAERRLASSITGMMWPIPGLESKAACDGFSLHWGCGPFIANFITACEVYFLYRKHYKIRMHGKTYTMKLALLEKMNLTERFHND